MNDLELVISKENYERLEYVTDWRSKAPEHSFTLSIIQEALIGKMPEGGRFGSVERIGDNLFAWVVFDNGNKEFPYIIIKKD
jgi:hypothetical protein